MVSSIGRARAGGTSVCPRKNAHCWPEAGLVDTRDMTLTALCGALQTLLDRSHYTLPTRPG